MYEEVVVVVKIWRWIPSIGLHIFSIIFFEICFERSLVDYLGNFGLIML